MCLKLIIIFFQNSPCLVNDCKYKYQKCVDVSTDTDSKYICPCQMGRVWHPGSEQCILPLPDPPTPRPIPTLSPDVKAATTVATKSASTLLGWSKTRVE